MSKFVTIDDLASEQQANMERLAERNCADMIAQRWMAEAKLDWAPNETRIFQEIDLSDPTRESVSLWHVVKFN